MCIFFFCFWLLRKPKQWHDLECGEGGHITEEKYRLSWNFIVYTCIFFFFCFWLLHKPKQWHDLDCDEGGHIAEEEYQLSWKWKLVSNCCCISDRKSRFTDKRSRCSLFQTAVVFTLQTARADPQTRGVGVVCFKLLLYLHYRQQELIYRREE